jgi:signal transduction histidine kinase
VRGGFGSMTGMSGALARKRRARRTALRRGRAGGAEARIRALQEAIEARDRFIAVVGHELRNPILPISLQAEMLHAAAERGDLARVTAGLGRLRQAIDQYTKRATVLLDVSRMLAGRFQLEHTAVDLAAIVRTVVSDFAPSARHAGCAINLDAPATLVGRWDETALQQVVENLVSNALKYGAGAPVDVALTCDGAAATLLVRDRGIGIAAADQARIFDRFERAVTRDSHGGFGVGLWIVNQFVREMGGRIGLDSRPGRGSAFTVSLPLAPEEYR